MSEEELVEEEIVKDVEEVAEDTEEVVEEEPEEEVKEEIIGRNLKAKNLLEAVLEFRNNLYNVYNKEDKQLKLLLVLYRLQSLHTRKIEEILKVNGSYTKKLLNELSAFGLVVNYNVSQDKRIYYKLTDKGKALADVILRLLDLW